MGDWLTNINPIFENLEASNCHPDCGVITSDNGVEHAHEDKDGCCWHENEDGYPFVIPEDSCE